MAIGELRDGAIHIALASQVVRQPRPTPGTGDSDHGDFELEGKTSPEVWQKCRSGQATAASVRTRRSRSRRSEIQTL